MGLDQCERAMVALDDGSVVDAIIGYRAWHFDAKVGRARLRSLHVPDVYWSDEPMRSVCRCQSLRSPIAAHDTCRDNCGLYAWRSPPSAMLASANKVWGTIYMWGDVIIHEKIIRAEYARVAGLYPIGYQRQRRLVEMAALQFNVPLLALPEGTRPVYARMQETMKSVSKLRVQLGVTE